MYRRDELDAVSEADHDAVFGSTFARYSEADLEEFLRPLDDRLQLNGVDARELFAGASVLDAGCGGGRGSLLMLRAGAAYVTAIDVSQQNVDSTRMVIERAGFANARVELGSLESLPFENESFDFVWCNGVLMHTAVPSATLLEIIRVLRKGGRAWIYVYGSGGMYWRFMSTFRRTFANVHPDLLVEALAEEGLPTGRVAEILDDWKAPFLRAYENALFESALIELGCDVDRLFRGMPYDTSEQMFCGVSQEFIGEGDLRYLVTRRHEALGAPAAATVEKLNGSHLVELPESRVLSAPAVEERVEKALRAFERDYSSNALDGISRAARAQLLLRDVFLPSPSEETLVACLRPLED